MRFGWSLFHEAEDSFVFGVYRVVVLILHGAKTQGWVPFEKRLKRGTHRPTDLPTGDSRTYTSWRQTVTNLPVAARVPSDLLCYIRVYVYLHQSYRGNILLYEVKSE